MLVKTSELIGAALDWAVAKSDGATNLHYDTVGSWWFTLNGKDRTPSKSWAQAFNPSSNWAHGGPIIEREKIDTFSVSNGNGWCAQSDVRVFNAYGETPLIAACRCYVASILGAEVEIPEGLK